MLAHSDDLFIMTTQTVSRVRMRSVIVPMASASM